MTDIFEPNPLTDEAFPDDDREPLSDEEIERLIAEHEAELAQEEFEEAERAANAPTPEEIEAMALTRDYHMENFQYIDRTHTSKEDALEHKRLANPRYRKKATDPAFHTRYFSFDELVTCHRNGLTFRRLPYKATDAEKYTQMLIMDIDDDKIKSQLGNHITESELSSILESEFPGNWEFTSSTSGTQFNYHVFIFLDEPILCTKESYGKAHDHAELVLCNRLRAIRHIPASEKHFFITDPAGRSPQQTFYGCCQSEERKIELMSSDFDAATGRFYYRESAAHLERSDKAPAPVPANHVESTMPYTREEWLLGTVPTSPTQLINILRMSGELESGRIEMPYGGFRAWLPYMKHGATKLTNPIEIGERNRRVSLFSLQLYNVFRATNWFLNELGMKQFTQNDLLNSFQDYVSRAYKETYDFRIATYRDQLQEYAKANAKYTDAEWCEKCAKFAIRHGRRRNLTNDDRPVRTVFRSKTFCLEETTKILQKFATGGNVATFNSKADLINVLREYDVSYTTFVKHAKKMGYTIEYNVGPGGSRCGSGRRANISIEDILKKIGGILDGKTICYTGILDRKERMWLSRHGYTVRKV